VCRDYLFRHFILIINGTGETLTDDQIHEIISDADTDGDGYINYEGKHGNTFGTFFERRSRPTLPQSSSR
jgi:hypothetical protein